MFDGLREKLRRFRLALNRALRPNPVSPKIYPLKEKRIRIFLAGSESLSPTGSLLSPLRISMSLSMT